MSALEKYEFQSVDWKNVSDPVADGVLQQYRNRLDTSIVNFADLDGKGRYGLTGLIGLTTAILAYSNGKDIDLSLRILLVGLVVSALCFAASLWTRNTSGTGVTTHDMKLGSWSSGMTNEHARNEMIGVVICQYAENIEQNESTNSKKSTCIKAGLASVLLTIILSVVSLYAVCLV